MADFRGGNLWRYEPVAGRLERITSNGEPRDLAVLGDKVYVGADGRFLSGIVSRYDAVTGVREDGIDLLACAMAAGDGVVWAAGCPLVQRLSTGDGRLRKLVERFLPFQSPATVENSRVQFRELAIGGGTLWVLGDALDQRLWRVDARNGRLRATIALGFPPTSVAVAGGRSGSRTASTTASCRSTSRPSACSRPSGSVAARRASPRARARSGWRTRSTGRCRAWIRPRAASSRRSTSVGRRAASRSATGRSG